MIAALSRCCNTACFAWILFAVSACSSTDNFEPPMPLEYFSPPFRVATLWNNSISKQVNRQDYRLKPIVVNDTLYAVDNTGLLVAFSRQTGGRLWSQEIDSALSTSASTDNTNLYFGTLNGDVIAFNLATRRELWRAKMSSEIIVSPTYGAGRIAARSIDGRVSLFSANNGSEIWTYRHTVPALSVRGNSNVLLLSDLAVLGLANGKLIALSIQDGTPIWQTTLSEPIGRNEIERLSDVDTRIITDAGYLYAAGYNGALSKILPSGGRILWSRDISLLADLQIVDDALYLVDANSTIWALDKQTGNTIWKQDKLRARQLTAPTIVGESIVFGDLEGYVHWLSRTDGHFLARKRVSEHALPNSATVDGETIFVQTKYGSLKALEIIKN